MSIGQEKSGPNPTHRGKGGFKRSLLTDANGVPLAVVIDGANRHDMELTRPPLEALKVGRPSLLKVWPQGLRMDKDDDYSKV